MAKKRKRTPALRDDSMSFGEAVDRMSSAAQRAVSHIVDEVYQTGDLSLLDFPVQESFTHKNGLVTTTVRDLLHPDCLRSVEEHVLESPSAPPPVPDK